MEQQRGARWIWCVPMGLPFKRKRLREPYPPNLTVPEWRQRGHNIIVHSSNSRPPLSARPSTAMSPRGSAACMCGCGCGCPHQTLVYKGCSLVQMALVLISVDISNLVLVAALELHISRICHLTRVRRGARLQPNSGPVVWIRPLASTSPWEARTGSVALGP
jgi:hypothetical protein